MYGSGLLGERMPAVITPRMRLTIMVEPMYSPIDEPSVKPPSDHVEPTVREVEANLATDAACEGVTGFDG